MNEDQVLELLQKVGAFRGGHFVYTSGRHGDMYVNKDALFTHPEATSTLSREFALRFADKNIDVVIGPAIAAAILAQWTAFHLSAIEGREVQAVYADKDNSRGFVLKRGYDKAVAGKRVLVVEDLVTTGNSVKNVIDVVRACEGVVAGVAVLCNRGDVTSEMLNSPEMFVSLLNINLDSWEENACELCNRNIPVNTDVGHGKEFVKSHQSTI